ncbi:MAG: MBOAT family O-acyltransferase [Thermoanaerobaculales bacterium]
MTFTSQLFLFAFLPASLAAYVLVPRRARLLVLAVASFAFCAWASPLFTLPLAAVIAIDYACSRVIARRHDATPTTEGAGRMPASRSRAEKLALAISVAANLGLLAVFKYAAFASANLDALLATLGLHGLGLTAALHFALPLGISFYTFQSLAYTLDVYHRRTAPARSLLEYASFLAFFPRLTAGPILRFKEFSRQLREPDFGLAAFTRGVLTFSIGLGKKVLIANPCGTAADFAFGAGSLAVADAWFGLLAFAFQIYFDFSGYTDMAIGIGLMFGLELPANFDRPYCARSITEFWRRWHITLSNWLRDYLFLPIAYSTARRAERFGLSPHAEEYASYVTAALVTMALAGLWHGAAWTFVIWGLIHGCMMAIERGVGRKRFYKRLPDLVKGAITFLVVLVAWVFFRSATLGDASRYLASLLGLGHPSAAAALLGGVLYTPYHMLVVGLAALLTWFGRPTRLLTERPTALRASLAFALVWLSLAVLFVQSYRPFLYSVF